MKRLYVAFTLIVISLFICIFSSVKVEKHAIEMRNELAEISTAIKENNTADLNKLLARAESRWRKTETLYSFIVDADKIEEMNIGIEMIKAHLEDKNKEHALERLHECELMLSEIVENEKLSIKNIM